MNWTVLIVCLFAVAAAAGAGVLFRPGDWYRSLRRPGWTPPDRAFPVVWTLLYLMMALAAGRVAAVPGHEAALALWALQLVLNALWSPVFFGLRDIRRAMAVLAALWLAVAATMLAFFQADGLAGAMLLPYLTWVSVAAALNWSVMRLNPDRRPLPRG